MKYLIGTRNQNRLFIEIPLVLDRVLSLQPRFAAFELWAKARQIHAHTRRRLVDRLVVPVEEFGEGIDHGGVFGHVEAPEEGDLGDNDYGD